VSSSARAGTSPAHINQPVDRAQSLLRNGVVAGPIYLAVGVIQGLVRDGFDFARHPLSVLANGQGGWVQVANFVVTGLMVIAAAMGLARALQPHKATSWLLGVFGASMLVAAVFRADPIDGFPPGTPEGMPTSISTHGMIHFIAGALGFTCLGVSALVAAWALSRRQDSSLAKVSLVSGIVVLAGFFAGPALSSNPVIGIWIAVVVGWAWLAILSWHLSRRSLHM
jgi:hypothetical membrane protein